jgi:hypothetical protein
MWNWLKIAVAFVLNEFCSMPVFPNSVAGKLGNYRVGDSEVLLKTFKTR